jgi:hypothetical protein
MVWIKFFVAFTGLFIMNSASAQRVVYSEPDKEDTRQTSFEIIGKLGDNIFVYKNNRENHNISAYDMNMKEVEKIPLKFVPGRVLNVDFLAFPDMFYMFYQYHRKNVVYCMAAKMDINGKPVGEPIMLDSTHISFLANNKIYNIIFSEDKQKILAYKINSKNERKYVVTPVLFNKELQLLEKKSLYITMPERNDFLTEFSVDNEGNIVFSRAVRIQQNENIQAASLMIKKRNAEELVEFSLPMDNLYLDEVKLKVDNHNKTYILSSLYSKKPYGNIEGIYNAIWDAERQSIKSTIVIELSDQIRSEARGDNGMKTAFNDYFIRNMIVKRDGGFLIAAESFFTTGRSGNFNRGYYPFNSPATRLSDYYMFGYGSSTFNRWNSFNSVMRYHAQNIAVFSFDSTGRPLWNKVISKAQYDDETDAFISYQLMNTGDQLHFLFNQQERRLLLLTDHTIIPGGEMNRVPTLKNLDKGYDFMPKYGKQIGSRQIIFPCMYRNYLCFARLEL